jgi:hypothetical protein
MAEGSWSCVDTSNGGGGGSGGGSGGSSGGGGGNGGGVTMAIVELLRRVFSLQNLNKTRNISYYLKNTKQKKKKTHLMAKRRVSHRLGPFL